MKVENTEGVTVERRKNSRFLITQEKNGAVILLRSAKWAADLLRALGEQQAAQAPKEGKVACHLLVSRAATSC